MKLQNKRFEPTVCSTAAKSSMKVILTCASCTSLQCLCCYHLHQLLPDYVDTLEMPPLPAGLKQVLHNSLGVVKGEAAVRAVTHRSRSCTHTAQDFL